MLGLSPETLMHREIGKNPDAKKDRLKALKRNLKEVENLIRK